MTQLTRSEVEHIVGPLDESLIIEILNKGATREELVEAFEWTYADDVLARELHREPTGRVSDLCEIISRSTVGNEEDRRTPPGD